MHKAPGPQKKGEMVVNRYSMFMPRNVSQIFYDYPELRGHSEFAAMRPEDVVFAWYMGHRASPAVFLPEAERSEFAIRNSYGKISEEKYARLIGLNFSEEMKTAIAKMGSFNLNARIEFLKITETVMQSWKEIANTKIDMKKLTKGENTREVKEYVSATKEILSQMPKLLQQMEESYSIVNDPSAGDESEVINFLDDWHDQNAITKPH